MNFLMVNMASAIARGRVRTTTTATTESRNINYLITESEVVTGKSQTEALPY